MDSLPIGMCPFRNLALIAAVLDFAGSGRKDRRIIGERQCRRLRSTPRIGRRFLIACSSLPTVLPSILPSTDTSRTVLRQSVVLYCVSGFALQRL